MTDETFGLEIENEQEESPQDPLPLLLETTLSLAQLSVILVGVITTVVSLIVGSTWLAALTRGGVAIVALGLLFWALNWLVARGMIEATVAEARAKMDSETDLETDSLEQTMEMEA